MSTRLLALVIVLASAAAFAGPTRLVDVTVVYKRTWVDTGDSRDSKDPKCVQTSKAHSEFHETMQVTATKVPMTDTADRLELSLGDKSGKLTGKAQYTFAMETHAATCDSKQDVTGGAQAEADAKAMSLNLWFDKKPSQGDLTIAITYPDSHGSGSMTVAQKNQQTFTTDATDTVTAQANTVATQAGVTLQPAASLAELVKQQPGYLDIMKALAQDKPLVIQTTGKNVDITYTDDQSIDLTKSQPPEPNVKATAIHKVTTELSIHATPSK